MKRLAVSTLAFALILASGSAFATDRDYVQRGNYGDSGDGYDDGAEDAYGSDDEGTRHDEGTRYDTAQVTSVDPILSRAPPRRQQECWIERDRSYGYNDRRYDDRYDQPYDSRYGQDYGHRGGVNGGAVLGAIIGGALGNQAGQGDGKTAATIAGAVVGAAIGNSIANDRDGDYRHRDAYGYDQYDDRYDVRDGRTVQRCHGVAGSDDGDDRVVGYNVTYRYAGQTYHTTTSHHPGSTIRVRVDVQPADADDLAYGGR